MHNEVVIMFPDRFPERYFSLHERIKLYMKLPKFLMIPSSNTMN